MTNQEKTALEALTIYWLRRAEEVLKHSKYVDRLKIKTDWIIEATQCLEYAQEAVIKLEGNNLNGTDRSH